MSIFLNSVVQYAFVAFCTNPSVFLSIFQKHLQDRIPNPWKIPPKILKFACCHKSWTINLCRRLHHQCHSTHPVSGTKVPDDKDRYKSRGTVTSLSLSGGPWQLVAAGARGGKLKIRLCFIISERNLDPC